MRRRVVACWAAALLLAAAPAVPAADLCGDADGSGTVTVSDGVQTLRAAAALGSSCTLERCDLDDSGAVTLSDGVKVLRAAAGLAVVPACPHTAPACESLTATLTLETPEPIGAANLALAYPTAAVVLPGSGEAAAERVTILTSASLLGDGSPNDTDERVDFNLIAIEGVASGPLLAVRFDCLTAAPPASAFACALDTVVTTDAVTPITGASCTVDVTAE